MILRTLGYYDDFVCIGGACQNSCCIGWELDIDEATCDYYRSVPGPFGDRLRSHMAAGSFRDEDCHTFCLTVDGRCPLLNSDGLCDIVLNLGPEALCEICSEYPRYTFELGDAVEKSLTISCEEAARLMFTRTRPLAINESPLDTEETGEELAGDDFADTEESEEDTFENPADDGFEEAGDEENEDIAPEITFLRAELIRLLQDRALPLKTRVIRAIRLTEKAQALINEAPLSETPLMDSLTALFREEADVMVAPAEENDCVSHGENPVAENDSFSHIVRPAAGNDSSSQAEDPTAEGDSFSPAEDPTAEGDSFSPAEGLAARLDLLSGCEVLSSEWTDAVDRIRTAFDRQTPDWPAFMGKLYYPRQVDYEHLLVYFLFRYMPRAAYDFDAAGKLAFAVFATLVIRDLDWAVFQEKGGDFTVLDRIRTVGIVSREIEHSDYNLDTLFEDIAFDEHFHAEGLIRQL